ncbi:MAG: hypothetical protein LDL31_06605 [Prosthecobacter sp.]|jgi:hypothetical protein|nr:hypothetical protein [Prosthecobacter sp.]
MSTRNLRRSLSILCLGMVCSGRAFSQETVPDASRLTQLETIYHQQLRTKHVPLLSQYLIQLQQQAARAADPSSYQAEIARVQALISSGGMVDLVTAARELATGTPPSSPAPAPAAKGQAITGKKVLSLTPALAHSIRPVPTGSAIPENAAVGRVAWRLDAVEPGTYQVVLHFSQSADAQAEVLLQLAFAGQLLEAKLPPAPAPLTEGGKRRFQLLRLGELKLEQRVEGAEMTLTAGDPESKSILLRHLHLSLKPPG